MDGGYSIEKMVRVIAWNRMHNVVKMHGADAEIKESKKKQAGESL